MVIAGQRGDMLVPMGSLPVEAASLSRLVDAGYAAGLGQASWTDYADQASQLLGCRAAFFHFRDATDPQRSFRVSGGLGEEFAREMAAADVEGEEDLYWRTMSRAPAGTVHLADDIVPRERQHDLPLYRRLSAPWNLEYHLMGVVNHDPQHLAVFSLARSARDTPFRPEDKPLFGSIVLSHLRRSLDLGRWVGNLADTNAIFEALCNEAPYGLLVADGQGRLLMSNRKADRMLVEGDGLGIARGGGLEAHDPAAHARLQASLAAVNGSSGDSLRPPPVPVLVPRRSGRPPYYVVVTPLGMRSMLQARPGRATCAYVIHDEQPSVWTTLSPAFIAAYDLSRSEVRLCDALLGGRTLPEAAELLAISRNTAKTHLARIFDKTGVRSQNALMRLLAFGAHNRGSRL